MRALLKWIDKVEFPNIKDEDISIHCVCYNPDGTQLIVAARERVLVYDPKDGTLLNTLKAHKDVVNCVAYARDGKKFASGAADKTVIVWSPQLEGLLKYSHGDSVQCMCFNPISHHLATCSTLDFAFWSSDQKAVQKYKIHSRINACCWTNDGQYLILGLANGSITIRNKSGEEKGRIDRPGGAASCIYGVQCCPPSAEPNTDTIAVTDWNQTLSFHTLSGQMIGKERSLGFDPLCLTYLPNGEYCLVSGCTGNVHCFTREGVRLGILGDNVDTSWIWSVAVHPNGQSYTIGCQNGTLSTYTIAFTTVHALYRERYAFREHMCDVIIQHLISGQKVRIKCRDLVQKIAIYRQKLAVQLPERVVLYELNSVEDQQPMHYKAKEKIQKKFDCSLLVVCACHIVLCQDQRLQCLDFNGVLHREWLMDSFIRYIKVIGGPSGREGLMVGLKNGKVCRIFLDNALPLLITSAVSAVRCLDVNANRTKIAVVDDGGRLVVRDIYNDTLLFQDTGVNSVTWNTHLDSMLCYTHTTGGLSVRVGNLPPRAPQQMLGVVVGLCGATAFCLRGNIMHNIPLALGATMWQFIEAGLFEEAHQVACLGVTNADWEGLARSALEALHLNIARNAYVKIRNLPWLQLIGDLMEKQKRSQVPKEVLQAEICAYSGKHKEAARFFEKCSLSIKALEMYTDLRMFDLAQEFIRDGSAEEKKNLVRKRAEWAYSVKEPRAAAELLLSVGEHQKAIEIVSEQGWADVLYDIGRRLSQSDRESLELVAYNLKRLKALPLAAEVFKKLGNEAEVVQLHVEAHDWVEAFHLANDMPDILPQVHYQHAQWLAENDQFIEAHEAYLKAGRIKDANRLLKQLSNSAIEEERFLDASYFYWLLSKQYLNIYYDKDVQNPIDFHLKEYHNHLRIAKIYYAYSVIFNYMKEPFTTYSPVSLFNVSRFILNEVEYKGAPKGVSMFAVLFTLAKQAKFLQANKLCLVVNKRLQSLKPPSGVQEQIDINYLNSKACKSGFNDPEELLPLCYKCSNYSQHLNGNTCPTCRQDYIFSFISFDKMLRLCGKLLKNHPGSITAFSAKQNVYCLIQTVTKPTQICLSKRNASTSLAGPSAQKMKNDEKITPLGWFLMLIPVTTFGLGCWQVKRKFWKEQLIKDMEKYTQMPPVDLPEDLSTLNDMEYRSVKVKGYFLHDKELLMGPRSFVRPDGAETAGGLFSQRDTGNGYWVITPFKLSGRDDVVLINRGWIPRKNVNPESRLKGQIEEEVEMTCVVRKGEQRPQFTPDHKGTVFLYRDLSKMSALTGAQPVFLDASYASSVPSGPIGGQTRITLHNDHLSYLITWYGLSLATGYLWYRNILKRKPF